VRAKSNCGHPGCGGFAVCEGLCEEHRRPPKAEWNRLRANALDRAGHKCEKCGAACLKLEVHRTRSFRLDRPEPVDGLLDLDIRWR
jgi:hypothetical protein